MKHWSSTPKAVGETEYYALVEAAAEGLVMVALGASSTCGSGSTASPEIDPSVAQCVKSSRAGDAAFKCNQKCLTARSSLHLFTKDVIAQAKHCLISTFESAVAEEGSCSDVLGMQVTLKVANAVFDCEIRVDVRM